MEIETGEFVGSRHVEHFAKEYASIFLYSGEAKHISEMSNGINWPVEIILEKIMEKRKTIARVNKDINRNEEIDIKDTLKAWL